MNIDKDKLRIAIAENMGWESITALSICLAFCKGQRNPNPSTDHMKTGTQLIEEERQRQISKEGYEAEHDDAHTDGAIVRAAVCYALPEDIRSRYWGILTVFGKLWPWSSHYWKPTPSSRVRELVKAGALIAAEIDRLQREKAKGEKPTALEGTLDRARIPAPEASKEEA